MTSERTYLMLQRQYYLCFCLFFLFSKKKTLVPDAVNAVSYVSNDYLCPKHVNFTYFLCFTSRRATNIENLSFRVDNHTLERLTFCELPSARSERTESE